MESISNAELIDLAFSAADHIYAQFQFWLSITFALIVACFVARDQLGLHVRKALAVLYITATCLIVYRLVASGVNATNLNNEIHERGIVWIPESAPLAGLFQMGVILFGVTAALWFLYSTYEKKDT